MATIIELSLNFELASGSCAPDAITQVATPVPGIVRGVRRDSVVCSWCKGCPLDGLCDDDACALRPAPDGLCNDFFARKMHGLCAPSRFPNLGVFIQFKKQCGWA